MGDYVGDRVNGLLSAVGSIPKAAAEHGEICAVFIGLFVTIMAWGWQIRLAHRIREREAREAAYLAYVRAISLLSMHLEPNDNKFPQLYAEAWAAAEAAALLLPASQRDSVLFFPDIVKNLRGRYARLAQDGVARPWEKDERVKILKGRWQEGGERAKAMMRRDFERHAIPKTPFAFLGL